MPETVLPFTGEPPSAALGPSAPGSSPSGPLPGAAAAGPDVDPALAAERAYVATARAALRRMLDEVTGLDLTDVAANKVSAEVVRSLMELRISQLRDDPDTPLFFGRVDGRFPGGEGRESFRVGRRHVHDEAGEPLVVDWRAPISTAFYRAVRTDPMGVELRRRYGWTGGTLTVFEDEHLTGPGTGADAAEAPGRLLAEEIERPRVGPMRDIVATIQPDQDAIVRADATRTVCVQGAPGTGKTAVGLHRIAWLLYEHRERLSRSGTLVLGPNRAFLDWIRAVLPALGEVQVTQSTVEDLLSAATGLPVRATEPVAAARVKGDERMAEVLRRAVWSGVRPAAEGLLVVRGSRRLRVPAYEIDEIVGALRERGVRYGSGRDMLHQRLAHAVLVRMEDAGESPDDRTQDAVARSREVRRAVEAVWPAVEAPRVVMRLLGDPAFLAACADGVLTEDERAAITWARPARGPRSVRWTAADVVLADEVCDLLTRTPGLGHVVIDEAQDLSPMQLRAVARRFTTGSATVLGDVAQGTTPWASPGWAETLRHLGRPDAVVEELTLGFRVPRQILDLASRLLPHIAPGLSPARSVRHTPGALTIRQVTDRPLLDAVTEAARELLDREGSVGVITPDALTGAAADALTAAGLPPARPGLDEPGPVAGAGGPGGTGVAAPATGTDGAREHAPEHAPGPSPASVSVSERLSLVPASLAKGLEFDHVVVAEPADVADAEERGLRRLYVVLTRAVSSLTIVHARPLPPELAAEPAG